jgi:hypothetical protein
MGQWMSMVPTSIMLILVDVAICDLQCGLCCCRYAKILQLSDVNPSELTSIGIGPGN